MLANILKKGHQSIDVCMTIELQNTATSTFWPTSFLCRKGSNKPSYKRSLLLTINGQQNFKLYKYFIINRLQAKGEFDMNI